MPEQSLPQSEFILYQTEDRRARVQCRLENETLWLTQAQIADLFQTIQIVGAPLAGAPLLAGTPVDELASVLNRAPARGAPTVGNIVGAYKSLCLHHYLQLVQRQGVVDGVGRLWQRNYWEHIIRNENALNRIRQYITHNPQQWEKDDLYIECH